MNKNDHHLTADAVLTIEDLEEGLNQFYKRLEEPPAETPIYLSPEAYNEIFKRDEE